MLILNTILQGGAAAVDTVTKSAAETAEKIENTSAPILEIMTKGGFVMIILALCLLIAIFFIIERFLYIKSRANLDHNLMSVVMDIVLAVKIAVMAALL